MSKRAWPLGLLVLMSASALAVAPLPAPKPLDAPPAQATETASGMSYLVIKAGPDQNRMARGDFIEYRADVWSADGVTRANSKETGAQIGTVRRLISEQPGLARALLTTPVGETRRWWIQPERMLPGYPGMPNLPHVIDLTVLGEKSPVQTPDQLTPPADALRTSSGLAYKILKKGPGGDRPQRASTVVIDYSGWDGQGRLFDSSVTRGERASLPLPQLIAGWQEGLPLMARGDSFRFWIPGHLAYDGEPGSQSPKGMLVFDITLHDFSNETP
ncbi:FKBP-type peptidyl-prolyl cis-trans isomerase [Arenimonas daejeonensis]|uniref:FKBP-type peptidyl-prolyl cis-trans isomerase n=1 Tax=Arenimonas daejeonensis TaxID=370777 RepID=UPI0011BEA792|nr:FKBP-type peptidyl-prolyl cis-trans isomerase [Arenimonas daejeonensis]